MWIVSMETSWDGLQPWPLCAWPKALAWLCSCRKPAGAQTSIGAADKDRCLATLWSSYAWDGLRFWYLTDVIEVLWTKFKFESFHCFPRHIKGAVAFPFVHFFFFDNMICNSWDGQLFKGNYFWCHFLNSYSTQRTHTALLSLITVTLKINWQIVD